MKISGIIMAFVGTLACLYGIIGFNSVASQFVRAAGGYDNQSMFLLFGGGLFAILGLIMAVVVPSQTNKCPNCASSNALDATHCGFCNCALSGEASINHSVTEPEILNPQQPLQGVNRPKSTTVFCTECGGAVVPGSVFCGECGGKL